MNGATSRATTWFVGFALVVIIIFLVVLGWQIDRRTDSIQTINESAQRIEEAALHTEEVLVEVVEARDAPEAVAQQQAVREALAQIRDIHAILCSAPDLADVPECDG